MGSKLIKAVYGFRSLFAGTISGIAAYNAAGQSDAGVAAGILVGALVTIGLYAFQYKVHENRVKKARSKSSSNQYNFESSLYNQPLEPVSYNSKGLGKILE
ncbi:MAG: hypothetical protein QXX36_00880 [Candidatus Rehaiarchaeum fermentans]|nr:hypothetical protein [Candidatus Rehaiarchaeum fermentans]MCW1302171.1 hypothetical protein [Candidatus Rehaiarchaeum fermentans]